MCGCRDINSSDLLSRKDLLPRGGRTVRRKPPTVSPLGIPSAAEQPHAQTCVPSPSQGGPHWMTHEARDTKAQLHQPNVARLRSHLSLRVPWRSAEAVIRACIPRWFLPLPSLAAFPFLPQLFIQVYQLNYMLSQNLPLRGPTKGHRKGTHFNAHTTHFFTLKRKHNQVIYANSIVSIEVPGWLWI